jgi:uncharacterized alkaline shock family protein YloU
MGRLDAIRLAEKALGLFARSGCPRGSAVLATAPRRLKATPARWQRKEHMSDFQKERSETGGDVGAGSTSADSRSNEVLDSEQGQTTIADGVVTKVAGISAAEVPGVHELGAGAARAVGAMTQKVGLTDSRSQGVSVEVGEREAAVDLTVVIDYGESIPQVSEEIRQQVIKRVEGITGLQVVEVNISVNDLYFPGDDEPEESRVA